MTEASAVTGSAMPQNRSEIGVNSGTSCWILFLTSVIKKNGFGSEMQTAIRDLCAVDMHWAFPQLHVHEWCHPFDSIYIDLFNTSSVAIILWGRVSHPDAWKQLLLEMRSSEDLTKSDVCISSFPRDPELLLLVELYDPVWTDPGHHDNRRLNELKGLTRLSPLGPLNLYDTKEGNGWNHLRGTHFECGSASQDCSSPKMGRGKLALRLDWRDTMRCQSGGIDIWELATAKKIK